MTTGESAAKAGDAKLITVKELAARHKIEPRRLRLILQSTGMRAKDGRYEWKDADEVLKKLPAIIRNRGF